MMILFNIPADAVGLTEYSRASRHPCRCRFLGRRRRSGGRVCSAWCSCRSREPRGDQQGTGAAARLFIAASRLRSGPRGLNRETGFRASCCAHDRRRDSMVVEAHEPRWSEGHLASRYRNLDVLRNESGVGPGSTIRESLAAVGLSMSVCISMYLYSLGQRSAACGLPGVYRRQSQFELFL